ncbi:hypothetical protein H4S06_001108 [Coemansia sp. BCRC 34490]|nr:hypothetical protein H4S06_001108 [Coemansia sp. BCRC 34490]
MIQEQQRQTLQLRNKYDQVGDYLYSQDLCVGVFDGTDFNSGTCERANLTSSDSRFPTDSMIIRYNMIEPNVGYIAGVMSNLTSETSAQCVMTNITSTACWIWDNGFNECLGRYYYNNTAFTGSDDCDRTEVVEDAYAVYVRRSDNVAETTGADSSSSAANIRLHPNDKPISELLTLKGIVVISMVLVHLLAI